MALSTVSGILTRIGMGKLGRLGREPAQRYERQRPGELLHIDVKKLGRIPGGAGKRFTDGQRRHYTGQRTDAEGGVRGVVGWEYVHVAIDDATRLAYVEVLPDEKAPTAIGLLRRAIKHYASYGITIERLITDNGGAYISTIHAIACRALRIRHLRTRPYRPQTNGKAERFIRTMLGGWADGAIYRSSADRNAVHRSPQRAEQPPRVLHLGPHRGHGRAGRRPPMTRVRARRCGESSWSSAPKRTPPSESEPARRPPEAGAAAVVTYCVLGHVNVQERDPTTSRTVEL